MLQWRTTRTSARTTVCIFEVRVGGGQHIMTDVGSIATIIQRAVVADFCVPMVKRRAILDVSRDVRHDDLLAIADRVLLADGAVVTAATAPMRPPISAAVGAACVFSLGIAGQVLTFHTTA